MNNEAGQRKTKYILNKYFVLTLFYAQNDKTQLMDVLIHDDNSTNSQLIINILSISKKECIDKWFLTELSWTG